MQTRTLAQVLGGDLVTINSADENTLVQQFFTARAQLTSWLELNDAAVEGTFVWASAQAVTYTNWLPGEPNAFFPYQDYAVMYSGPGGVGRRDQHLHRGRRRRGFGRAGAG